MAHVELPQEELNPLIDSMKNVFAPFVEAIPAIVKIPQEMERLTETIKQDVKSGQPDRFVSGSKKSKDSVDMIQMMKDFNERNSEEGKKRQKELEDLERIAQERQKAEADLEKVLQTGTPAEITETNEVKILNEKEIIEKQKEYLKALSESASLEQKIAEEKRKGEDADSDELVRLQESLENNNTLLQEQTEVLGDRLPRQKVPETVGARDFIPGPLMEAYDNIAETAMESGKALGSIFQPLIGLKKLFTKKEEYEDEFLEDKKKKDKKLDFSIVLTTLKFIALSATLVALIKSLYDLGKEFPGMKYMALPDNLKRDRGLFTQETNEQYFDRLINKEGKTPEEAQEIVNSDPIPMFNDPVELGPDGTRKKTLFEKMTDGDEGFNTDYKKKSDYLPRPFDPPKNTFPNLRSRGRERPNPDDLRKRETFDEKYGKTDVNVTTFNESKTVVAGGPSAIEGSVPYSTEDVIHSQG